MGLLDRAEKLEKSPSVSKPKKSFFEKLKKFKTESAAAPVSGKKSLLRRMENLREEFSPVLKTERKRKGLLERALEFQKQASVVSPLVQKEGLLKKSQRIKDELLADMQREIKETPFPGEAVPIENSISPAPDKERDVNTAVSEELELDDFIPDDVDLSSDEFPEMEIHPDILQESLSESDEKTSDDLLFDEVKDLEASFEEASPRIDEEVLPLPVDEILDEWNKEEEQIEDTAQESEPAEEIEKESEDESIPEYEYPVNSPAENDPALEKTEEIVEDEEKIPEDPFDAWVNEAEREADITARNLMATEDAQLESPSKQLFDQQYGFGTDSTTSRIRDQRKIEHFQSLFEISREIAAISDMETLLDNTLYALLGEVGSESACIFIPEDWQKENAQMRPVSYSGFDTPEEDWVLNKDDAIYEVMRNTNDIVYSQVFRTRNLSKMESSILDTVPVSHMSPLVYNKRFFGIVMLGPSLSEGDYNLNELEFFKYLCDLTAAGMERIADHQGNLSEREGLQEKNNLQSSLFEFARNVSALRSMDEIYDSISDILDKTFASDSHSLVLLSPVEKKFRIFSGSRISEKSMEKFGLSVSSDLAGLIGSLTRVYDLRDFRDNKDIVQNYISDDIALMRSYQIIPLISMNWLVGYIVIHDIREEWTPFKREMLVNLAELLAPVIANKMILQEKNSLFNDPFSPLEERLSEEIRKCEEFSSAVTLSVFKVKNIKRLIALNEQEETSYFLSELGKIISNFLSGNDFISRLGQGRYAVILTGRNRSESEIYLTKLKAEIKRRRLMKNSPVEIQFEIESISYPEDTPDIEKMLVILD